MRPYRSHRIASNLVYRKSVQENRSRTAAPAVCDQIKAINATRLRHAAPDNVSQSRRGNWRESPLAPNWNSAWLLRLILRTKVSRTKVSRTKVSRTKVSRTWPVLQPASRHDRSNAGGGQPIALEFPVDREARRLGESGADERIGKERYDAHEEQSKRRYSQGACEANEQLGHRIAPKH
jgi:hypothetical protein